MIDLLADLVDDGRIQPGAVVRGELATYPGVEGAGVDLAGYVACPEAPDEFRLVFVPGDAPDVVFEVISEALDEIEEAHESGDQEGHNGHVINPSDN